MKGRMSEKKRFYMLLGAALLVILLCIVVFKAPSAFVKSDNDIRHYRKYFAENLGDKAFTKIGLDESVFPREITPEMKVEHYVAAYHDGQVLYGYEWLMCLAVEYPPGDYKEEMARLRENYGTDDLSEFDLESFHEPYTLVTAEVVSRANGVLYTLTDGERTIVYVELACCDGPVFGMYLSRGYYIPGKYLPLGVW